MNKTNNVHLRCTDNDILRFKFLSEYYNMSTSDLIRFLLVKEINSNENLKTDCNNFIQHYGFLG